MRVVRMPHRIVTQDRRQRLGGQMLSTIKRTVKMLPAVKRLVAERDELKAELATLRQFLQERQLLDHRNPQINKIAKQIGFYFPIGHYYSAIPSIENIENREMEIWSSVPSSLPGIDLNVDEQVQLLDKLQTFYAEQPFGGAKQPDIRFWFPNGWFGSGDAIFLYSIMRHLKPKKIIEVGSGFSSAVILDTNDRFFEGRLNCTFIEPEPQRLQSLLTPADRSNHCIVEKMLQDVDEDLFKTLDANDILFIDSSHVLKTGSELNRIFFHILPALKKGVYIHFHDIFYPFEYPRQWVMDGFAWNECYALRAFLQYNRAFKIRLFNTFLTTAFTERLQREMPLCIEDPGAGIWLEKVVD
jgi:predicted O-methyltransferase YrrM